MQNSNIVLNNLFKQSTKSNYHYKRLYKNLLNPDFYYKAYSNIYRNAGSSTSGIDNETADKFSETKIKNIINLLADEKYQPKPVRRQYIPKKTGTKRALGIPSFTDRIVQEICREILEAIYEPVFLEQSHGFRPNRSCHTALNNIKTEFRGVNWFIEGDIKGFFDNIDHHILINILRRKIKDEKFIRLIWKFLRAGYLEDWKYYKTYSGVPQGGIVSPILANIYLNELDMYIINNIKYRFDKNEPKKRKRNKEYCKYDYLCNQLSKKIDSLESSEERNELIKQYKENKNIRLNISYYEPTDTDYKRLKYIRYADDFIIGVCGSKQDCQNIIDEISEFLNNSLNIELSKDKTLITHSSEYAKFLGYHIKIRRQNSVQKDKNGVTKRMHKLLYH